MSIDKRSITDLGNKPVGSLLMQYALPAIIAMTASSLYNMVDSIFIGQGVGAMAISGLALTFPLMNLGTAFGALVGMGASTLISLRLGQRDYESAQKILGNVFVLNCLIGGLFSILTYSFLDEILYFFGASDNTIGYARDYMQIILAGNLFSHMFFGLNAVLRAAGHPRRAMAATINAVVINIILDPIFIYGFDWGIRGAAIATIIAQVISLVWQFRILSDSRELLHFKRGIYRLNGGIVKSIFSIGAAPFMMNIAACLVVIFVNKGLKEYGGDLNVGAYGVVNRVIFVFVMIVMGINQGMQPIAGYNFGAKEYGRVKQVLKLSIIYATIVTTFGFVVGEFFPRLLVSAFTSDEELIALSVTGMRIVVALFPIVGVQIVTSNFFQSIGMAPKAILLSISRQILFLLPGIIFLPILFTEYTSLSGSWGVWCAMPISDLLSSILAVVLLTRELKRFNRAELLTK